MNTRVIAGLALMGAAVLASCSQDRSPAISLPTDPTFAKPPAPPPTCSFSTANNDARAYFTSNKDDVFALLDAMSTAYKNGGAAGATTAGFAVLARLGTATDLGDGVVKGTAGQGNTFANDVLLCMGAAPLDLTGALGPTGLLAVRDGSSSTPITSRQLVSGAPAYGAEPSSGNWPLSGPTLFYGVRLLASSLANEAASGVLFDLKTYPSDLTFVPEIRTGVCFIDDVNARILHKHGANAVVLPPAGSLSFCPTASNTQSRTFPGYAFAARVASWLAPQPAYAAAMAMPLGGGGAGLVSGLSEIGPVTYTSVVSFTQAPQNTSLSANPQFVPVVTVLNVTSNGNPLKGAVITLTVVGNNGSYNISNNVATTDDAGVATFPTLRIDKAGGYTMTATSELGGIAQVAFNISGL